MELLGPIMQVATLAFVIVAAAVHVDRRITRVETKVDYLWALQTGRADPTDGGPFRKAKD